MTADERYIAHLKPIIDECGEPAQNTDPSAKTLQQFFDGIVADRIRITKTDWQGHGLSGLVWNLPSLKPSIKTILIRHVVDRWHVFAMGATLDLPEPDTVEPNATAALPNDHDHGAVRRDSHAETASNPKAAPLPMLSGTAVFRRDWFDRLTDWVAAIVSLWK